MDMTEPTTPDATPGADMTTAAQHRENAADLERQAQAQVSFDHCDTDRIVPHPPRRPNWDDPYSREYERRLAERRADIDADK